MLAKRCVVRRAVIVFVVVAVVVEVGFVTSMTELEFEFEVEFVVAVIDDAAAATAATDDEDVAEDDDDVDDNESLLATNVVATTLEFVVDDALGELRSCKRRRRCRDVTLTPVRRVRRKSRVSMYAFRPTDHGAHISPIRFQQPGISQMIQDDSTHCYEWFYLSRREQRLVDDATA
jgi:hypothetical protein